MRILGGHDYYDFPMRWSGSDDDRLFIRTNDRLMEWKQLHSAMPFMKPVEFAGDRSNSVLSIVFAGVEYRFLYAPPRFGERVDRSVYWSNDDVARLGLSIPRHWRRDQSYRDAYVLGRTDRVRDEHRLWLSERSIAVVVPDLATVNRYDDLAYRINAPGVMKEIEAFRVLDGTQAFQELEMWVGNYMPSRRSSPPPRQRGGTVTLSDASRMAKHGMDRWSFRRPPAHRTG